MNKKTLINLIISISLILSIGLTVGYAVGYYQAGRDSFPEIKTVPEINPGVTTIKLLEVKNGELIGKISGAGARMAYSANDILELEKEENFQIPLNQINLNEFYPEEIIPENTLFIASKSGKYYYSVFDKRAFNIVPKNRIYFESAQEAEKEGYQKK